jgi:hypothetical protein
MKLCPQCEFIYEDDQRFCDMDGQELVHDPKPRAFTDNTAALPSLPQSHHAANTVTKIHIPIPEPLPSPVANPAASQPANLPSRWQPRGLAFAALAGLVLVALLFVVYYARTHQSQTPKANRSASQSSNQYDVQAHAQPATQSADKQSIVSPESVTPSGETAASEQAADRSFYDAASIGQTPSESSALPAGSEKSAARVRRSSTVVTAGASAETVRAPVIIRLTNGATIKADEAWEKREGVWYRQAGMVTFLKRSRVRSIERPTSPVRSQTGSKAEKSVAQNQPRVGKPESANPKNDSKVSSFLKKTGRILKKPFKT